MEEALNLSSDRLLDDDDDDISYFRGTQIPGAGSHRRQYFLLWRLVIFIIHIGNCFVSPSGAQNFEMTSRFLENIWSPVTSILTMMCVCANMAYISLET